MTEYFKKEKAYPLLGYKYFKKTERGTSYVFLEQYNLWYSLHSTDLDYSSNLIPITEDEMNSVFLMMELVS